MFTVQSCWGSSVEQDKLNESLFGGADLISCRKKDLTNGTEVSGTDPVKRVEKRRKERLSKKKGKYIVDVVKTKDGLSDDTYKDLNEDQHASTQISFSSIGVEENKFEKKLKKKKKRKREKENEEFLKSNGQEKNVDGIQKSKNTFVTKQKSQSELNELNDEPFRKKKKHSVQEDILVIEETKNKENDINADLHTNNFKNKTKKNSKSELMKQENTSKDIDLESENEKKKKKKDKTRCKDTKIDKDNVNTDNLSVKSFDEDESSTNLSLDSIPIHEQNNKKKMKKKKRKKEGNTNVEQNELNSETDNRVKMETNNRVKNTKKDKKKKKEVIKVTEKTKNDLPLDKNVLPTNRKKGLSKFDKFKQKLQDKLKGAQFRWINEKLYTCESSAAVDMFATDPKLFDVYHDGFTSQVQQWPQNPVDVISEFIKSRNSNDLVIADFGCGDAKLSRNVPNKVHSFDLVAANETVTACDMSKVPLSNNVIDIAVFCLSLMGTNVIDFLREAHRVLKSSGTLKIAEVRSRFDDIDEFVQDVSTVGFTFLEKDESNKMFVLFEFEKVEKVSSKMTTEITLKPCIYKRR